MCCTFDVRVFARARQQFCFVCLGEREDINYIYIVCVCVCRERERERERERHTITLAERDWLGLGREREYVIRLLRLRESKSGAPTANKKCAPAHTFTHREQDRARAGSRLTSITRYDNYV